MTAKYEEPVEPPPQPIPPELFVRDELLLSGPPEEIEYVMKKVEGQFKERGIGLKQATVIPQPDEARPGSDSFAAVACRISSARAVGASDARESALELFRNAASGTAVHAGRNYKTGRAVETFEGDPETGEGVSLEAGIAVTGKEAELEFYNQWALNSGAGANGGIGLFESFFTSDVEHNSLAGLEGKRNTKFHGEGVNVFVFDSSPYEESVDLEWVPIDPSLPNDTGGYLRYLRHGPLPGVPDARDHGVFVSSLVKAVAPEATVHLIRVLNDSNRGKLSILVAKLLWFIDHWREANPHKTEQCPLAQTVINLSLGVHVAPAVDRYSLDNAAHCAAVESELQILQTVLRKAYDLGAIVVAASGNDSHGAPIPFPAQAPACFDFVVDVGACNFQGGRASFSNQAAVYAPGGDHADEVDDPDKTKEGNVIGYAVHTAPGSRFAFWKGTSFAAPLVSGMVALLLSSDKYKSMDCGKEANIQQEVMTAINGKVDESEDAQDEDREAKIRILKIVEIFKNT